MGEENWMVKVTSIYVLNDMFWHYVFFKKNRMGKFVFLFYVLYNN